MESEITIAERELIIKMDSVPGCYLRAHMLPAGRRQRGFRLLDKHKNPLLTVRYALVESLVQMGFLQYHYVGGVEYHYYRTDKSLNRYDK